MSLNIRKKDQKTKGNLRLSWFHLILFTALLSSCESGGGSNAFELPSGWENAELIENLFIEPCKGGMEEERKVETVINGVLEFVKVEIIDLMFRCSQPVQAFQKQNKSGIDILIQPTDMNPDEIAACDCRYNMVLGVEVTGDELKVNVYYRGDNISGHSEPTLLASETVFVGEY